MQCFLRLTLHIALPCPPGIAWTLHFSLYFLASAFLDISRAGGVGKGQFCCTRHAYPPGPQQTRDFHGISLQPDSSPTTLNANGAGPHTKHGPLQLNERTKPGMGQWSLFPLAAQDDASTQYTGPHLVSRLPSPRPHQLGLHKQVIWMLQESKREQWRKNFVKLRFSDHVRSNSFPCNVSKTPDPRIANANAMWTLHLIQY